MSRTKDLYMDEFERECARLEEQGIDPDTAYDMAGDAAYIALGDRMADLADRARDAWKERDFG